MREFSSGGKGEREMEREVQDNQRIRLGDTWLKAPPPP